MRGTLRLNPRSADDRAERDEDQNHALEVDHLDLKLPLRTYEISYKVAEEGEFSLTTEFLMRLLKSLGPITEAEIGEFFSFTADETSHVISVAERKDLVCRQFGRVRLTAAGEDKFEGPAETPSLYEVRRKMHRIPFDLISYCPHRTSRLNAFARTLPEIPVTDARTAADAAPRVREAFHQHFREIQHLFGGRDDERTVLYSIDEVAGLDRGATTVPMTVTARKDAPSQVEPDLLGWKSGIDLDNRMAVLTACGTLLKNHTVPSSFWDPRAADYLQECAPDQVGGFFQNGNLDGPRFLRRAADLVGEFRKDRKTVRIFGTLWVERNSRKVLTAALEHAVATDEPPHEPLIWLRPATPYWGCSTKFDGLVDGLCKHLVGEDGPDRLKSILLTHDEKESAWRFRSVFDSIGTLRPGRVPRNFELLLVPGRFFAALVHAPMGAGDGFPMPLGVVSFDRALLPTVHELLKEVVAAGRPSAVSGESAGDLTDVLLEALRLPAGFPGLTDDGREK
ncbi:hypothetical protein [Caenispirillum salinarum]|uniref:hypothetical protein n=1 Tax=Caenispirillum salinarum TaxID=859058 RepID=UPI00384C5804